jgi:Flp pilus assembly protein TadB
MNANTRAEVIDEASKWNVGAGVVTMALFPLALPLLVLTAVAVVPLLLIPLAGALALAVVAAPLLLLWGLGRRAMRALRRPSTPVTSGRETRSLPTGPPPAKA